MCSKSVCKKKRVKLRRPFGQRERERERGEGGGG